MDEKMLQQAQTQFQLIKKILDEMELAYDADDKMQIVTIPKLSLNLAVQPQLYTLHLLSDKLLSADPDKRIDMALAVCAVNQCEVMSGGFDYDIASGALRFRISQFYRDCPLDGVSISLMLLSATESIAGHMDRFRRINNGTLPLQALYQEVL